MRTTVLFAIITICYGRNIDPPKKAIDEIIAEAWRGSEDVVQVDGFIRSELDMLYTPEQWAALQGQDTQKGLRDERYRWPSNIVPFESDDVFTSREWSRIEGAMREWEKYTCIRFKRRTNERDYIRFVTGSGCSSAVGRVRGGQRLTLARGCRVHSVIVHELGHAIGVHHEQTRPDRDNYVTIVPENIQTGKSHNFAKYTTSYVNTHNLPYDYTSVMHYSQRAFSKNGQPTIIAKYTSMQDKMGRAPTVSYRDIQLVNLMYKCAAWCGPRSCPPGGMVNQYCSCWCGRATSDMNPVYTCGLGGPNVTITAIPTRGTTAIPTRGTTAEGRNCVQDCRGLTDGDYQSCLGCGGYVSCSNGYLHQRQCPGTTVWDDRKKRCDYSSDTCDAISSNFPLDMISESLAGGLEEAPPI